MSFFVNNVELKEATFNQQEVKSIYFNTHLIWESFWVGWDNATWEDVYNLCKAKQNGEIKQWPRDVVLGATKDVNLSTPVIETSVYTMRIIGIDFDAPGVITFDCKYMSDNFYRLVDGDTPCIDFYNYCEVKPYIKPLRKGVATYSSSRNGSVTYTDSYVWELSEREIGCDAFSSISVANSTLTKAECTYGINAPYPCFTSNESRIKKYLKQYDDAWFLRGTACHNYFSNYRIRVKEDGTTARTSPEAAGPGFSPCFAIG